jgi:hypothetical protein
MATLWANSSAADFHGARSGAGFSGALKLPFARGMNVACDTCHDPHGNNNLYHVRTSVNGTNGISVTNGNAMKNLCVACHEGDASVWHAPCAACHAGEDGHYDSIAENTPTDSSDCASCHGHGRGFTHSPGGCHGCHVPADWPSAF